MRFFAGACLAVALLVPANAPAHADCRLTKGETVTIIRAEEHGVLTLADGTALKLANVDLPSASLPALSRLLGLHHSEKTPLLLGHSGKRSDRHGRLVGYPILEKRRYLQQELVESGLARVVASRDHRPCVMELLEAEGKAREARRGLWSDPAYAIRSTGDVEGLYRLEGTYQIVEGTIQRAASVRGRIYVNFDHAPERDFTMTVAPADVRLFKEDVWKREGNELPALAGRKVRIRGWLGRYGGPQMVVSVPEQVEFLDESRKPSAKAARKKRGQDGG